MLFQNNIWISKLVKNKFKSVFDVIGSNIIYFQYIIMHIIQLQTKNTGKPTECGANP